MNSRAHQWHLSLMVALLTSLLATQFTSSIPAGKYTAGRDLKALPKISKLSAQQMKSYSGEIFVLYGKSTGYYSFAKGHRINIENASKRSPSDPNTLPELLATIPKGTDIRYGVEGYYSFKVMMPKDSGRLLDFTGNLVAILENRKLRVIKMKQGVVKEITIRKNG